MSRHNHSREQGRGCARVTAALVAIHLGLAAPSASAVDAARFDCLIVPSRTIDLSSAVPGLVERVYVDRADTVSEGQVLASLDSRIEARELDVARARARAEADIHLWEASLEYDRVNLSRLESLHTSSHASSGDRDRARRDTRLSKWKLRRARDERELRQLELRRAEDVVDQKTVRSPFDGVVVRRFKSGGEYAEDDPILRLAQLDPLHVETVVPMNLFGSIRHGATAQVFPKGHDGRFYEATVSVIDRMGDAASNTFGVRLALPNPDYRLPAGLECTVEFPPAARIAAVDAAQGPLSTQAEAHSPGPVATTPSHVPVIADAAPRTAAPVPHGSPPFTNEGDRIGTPVAIVPASRAAPSRSHTTADAASAPLSRGELARSLSEPGPDVCRSVGPLDKDQTAEQLRAVLRDEGIATTPRTVSAPRVIGYIVLAPDQATSAATRAYRRRLADHGVRDASTTGSAYSGRLSLGVYDRRKPAERRRAHLVTLGFEVEVVPRTRERTSWWLDLSMPVSGTRARTLHEALDAARARLGSGPIGCDTLPQTLVVM